MPPPSNGHDAGRVRIEEATSVDEQLVSALAALLPQLSSSPPPGRAELEEIAHSDAAVLLVARDETGSLVGSLTLVLFRVPTGLRAWIEDVVVDEGVRGSGVGASLVRAALDRATAAGARSVDLTSRPSREAANRLYRRLGFDVRETNVYRWKDDGSSGGNSDSGRPSPPV
jgi:ribosomal protein S18 acetylase RimI-like enzyme